MQVEELCCKVQCCGQDALREAGEKAQKLNLPAAFPGDLGLISSIPVSLTLFPGGKLIPSSGLSGRQAVHKPIYTGKTPTRIDKFLKNAVLRLI